MERREGGMEPELRLIETLGKDGREPIREKRHLARMARSAGALGAGFDATATHVALRLAQQFSYIARNFPLPES